MQAVLFRVPFLFSVSGLHAELEALTVSGVQQEAEDKACPSHAHFLRAPSRQGSYHVLRCNSDTLEFASLRESYACAPTDLRWIRG